MKKDRLERSEILVALVQKGQPNTFYFLAARKSIIFLEKTFFTLKNQAGGFVSKSASEDLLSNTQVQHLLCHIFFL